ncbi:ATP-dependent DNA ligase [Streptomyces chrestomyceticus]|uniref:ATP-dependent DNA ligase n=1 Tax=Streptomyces chrestomyceticus TaxID=68185 RepID=UPI00340E9AA5
MLPHPVSPILAEPVAELPSGNYGFEAKWDGFRCLLERTSSGVELRSRRGSLLTRAFSDIAGAAERDLPEEVLLDGELVIWHKGRLDFSRLQRRLNRKATTVAREVQKSPANYVIFDLLHHAGDDLMSLPYEQRRERLEAFFSQHNLQPPWALCPMTRDRHVAEQWMREWSPAGIEGIVAKNLRQPYRAGARGWRKVRTRHTTEALIGAITGTLEQPRTLLLGRLDEHQHLRFVGHSTPLDKRISQDLGAQIAPATDHHPWEGRKFSTGWGSSDSLLVELIDPNLVVEVSGDTAVDAGRWRHPVRMLRLRNDLTPLDAPKFGSGNTPATG